MPANNVKTRRAGRFDAALVARHLKHGDSDREEARGQKIDHILSVAASLFASEGLAGVSMRRVAANAGVTLSTLQHYFGNRQNLVELTINSLLDLYIADFTAISRDTSIPAQDRFLRVMDELLGSASTPVIEAFYVHLWAAAAQDTVILEHIREAYAGYFEALSSIIGQMRPDWPVERVTSTALAVGTQVDGLLVTRLIGPPSLPAWDGVLSGVKGFWIESILRVRKWGPLLEALPCRRVRISLTRCFKKTYIVLQRKLRGHRLRRADCVKRMLNCVSPEPLIV